MRRFTLLLVFVLVGVIFSACVTQKKKEDVGPVGKAWHDMNARYNGYYNATVIMEESIAALEDQHTDNFNKILPLYKYSAAENHKAVAGELDNAIEKVSVAVNLHRSSHWVDDCYLLMGQAFYLKKDFEGAQETFEFLVSEFNPQAMAKNKAASKKRRKAGSKASSGSRAKSSGGSSSNDSKPKLTKKQREKLAKKKKKEREKERKLKNKEIAAQKKARKKGKTVEPSSRSNKSKKDNESEKKKKSNKSDKEEVVKTPTSTAPGSIRLGNLEPEVVQDKPEGYFMKHRPAYQDAVMWLARTYVDRENYTNAERMMNLLDESSTTFKDVRRELSVVQAYYYMKRKDFDKAIAPLEKAIELEKDNNKKARYAFIIAQLHQKEGRGDAAYAAFEEVVKYGPEYEMEFSARLQLAQNAWMNGKGTPEQAEKNLLRMLKDFKNVDYQDQIYFALADIALKQDQRTKAIGYLQQSLWNSTQNQAQKAESYLLLATLFYEDEDYVNAKSYYDSTLLVLTDTDERHGDVSRLANNLTDIAKNIEIITLQDSLLAIAKLTPEEKRDLAFELRKKEEEAKRQKLIADAQKAARDAASAKRQAGGGGPPVSFARNSSNPRAKGSSLNAVTSTSSFFAYDDRTVKRHEKDFNREWGVRVLEDNWRRSAQASLDFGSEKETEAAISSVLTEEEIDQILKDVPKTPDQEAAAHRAIEAAWFALGGLYRDRLLKNDKSIEALETLLNKYPGTQYELDSYYFLYLAHLDLENQTEAKFYFDKIVNEYPNTTYAKVLKDPNYVKEIMDEEHQLNKYYDETYAEFENGNFKTAYDRIAKVGQMFGATNSLQPRFALLNAMCVGNIQGKEDYVKALKDVRAKYPDSPEENRATEILRLLNAIKATGPGMQGKTDEAESPFTVEDDKLHYLLVVFDGEVDLNKAKIAVSDYNREFHKLDKLRISNIYLGTVDTKVPIIVVRRFKNKTKSMDFYDGVQKNTNAFLDKTFSYKLYPVTQNNYRQILKSKTLDGYQEFFELNYLN